MRAAVFHRAEAALTIEHVPEPQIGATDLMIAVKCCGICGSDLHMADVCGPEGGMRPLPAGTVMGHEFCGEVVEVGRDAGAKWQVGDRVTALPYIACGHCQPCLSGLGYRCTTVRYTGLGDLPGAYAEYLRIGSSEALLLPPGVDWRLGALVEPLAVGLHAVHVARIAPGERVLIMGAGPIGLAAAMWARHYGAQHVVVSDKVPARLELASKIGATATVNASVEDVVGTCKRAAGGRADVILECIGVPGTQQLAMDYAPSGGRIVIVGVCMAPDTVLPPKAISKELQINYVFMYRKRDFEITIELMDQGRIDPTPLLSSVVSFDDFPSAFTKLKTDKSACKVLLEPG